MISENNLLTYVALYYINIARNASLLEQVMTENERIGPLLKEWIERFDDKIFPGNGAEVVIVTDELLELQQWDRTPYVGTGYVSCGNIRLLEPNDRAYNCYYLELEGIADAVMRGRRLMSFPERSNDPIATEFEYIVSYAASVVRTRYRRNQPVFMPFMPGNFQIGFIPQSMYQWIAMAPELHGEHGFNYNQYDASIVERVVMWVVSKTGGVAPNLHQIIRANPLTIDAELHEVQENYRKYQKG